MLRVNQGEADMRYGMMVLALAAVAGCSTDAEDARAACLSAAWSVTAECEANYMAEVQNRRAAGLAILGGGLSNYGAAATARSVYTPAPAVTCYRVGSMMQCQ